MKNKWIGVVIGLWVFMFLLPGAFAKESVTVYTSLETDEIVKYQDVARKDLPDLEINIIRLSTGDLGARMLAEKSNTKVLKEKHLPMPKGWYDLLNPVFKGLIAMPDPSASGTGFLQIASILQMYGAKEGKEDGWNFLKSLDKNMAEYIKSGSRPAKMTAQGEFAVGCSFDFVVGEQKKQGFPVELVFPVEGAGYEGEANALMTGAKNPAPAKKFLDWAVSENAMQAYSAVKLGGR